MVSVKPLFCCAKPLATITTIPGFVVITTFISNIERLAIDPATIDKLTEQTFNPDQQNISFSRHLVLMALFY
ncbi:hypothetical protein NSMM_240035 [Nitrosomonas mobilis]|uniref:Uncharacterized protein n=1 Tax=Nitrosomonas mobilis TaxID=51642 RepID=A0A1G5SDN1_9PROT|nr:hypothetical protein NSMM_240035 [Nitrosomonas mobilis]